MVNEAKNVIVIVGPAGSGKTTLTAALGRWIQEMGFGKVIYVNLDPGAEALPYNPQYDVRKLVTVKELMRREKLGPNGAFIRAVEMMALRKTEIVDNVGRLTGDYVIVDTPGQMEPFVFSSAGPEIVSEFKRLGRVAATIITDLSLAGNSVDVVALRFLSVVIQLRLGVDVVLAINKSDLVKHDQLSLLTGDISLENYEGLYADMMQEIETVLNKYIRMPRILLISAKSRSGLEELYDALHEVYCVCGDIS